MAEWNASAYNQISALQEWLAEEQMRQLQLAGSERVLDVGCGDGKITAKIAARLPGGSVVGVDPSHSMIAFASERFGPPTCPNLRFVVGDARQLGFNSEFDLVVSFNALHWVLDQHSALSSIHAALKPGGSALLRLVPKGDRTSIEEILEETRSRPRWADYFAGFVAPFVHFTPDEYHALAIRSGLSVKHVRVEDRAWDFKTRDAFLAFCRTTCVFWLSRLPERDWPAFLTEMLDRYQFAAGNGPGEAHVFKFQQMEAALRRGESV